MARPQLAWLVDWFYERFLFLLLEEWTVEWKANLYEYEGPVAIQELCGQAVFAENKILINPTYKLHPKDNLELLRTLIHELGHVLFGQRTAWECGPVPHNAIFDLEKIAEYLTPRQRAVLLSFLPDNRDEILSKTASEEV